MKWNEVRQQFPNRCDLVESLNAKTRDNERIIDAMSVIDDFDNWNSAWKAYKEIHDNDQSRELYIFHTKNEDTKVIEQPYIGVRRKI
ncbi:hypothetical protein [Virgibacillus necropolis]|uniref:Uncharacterized protein n=1 Tax=Virgibacillus necropolis TaxID=163877 RepID=A0A221MH74_9BACI|nr:hypothetical protein [Virgibacillus necropolis]ASN06980.1 hypothetical protein CFK40_19160 [Virgibacillus necropolis]